MITQAVCRMARRCRGCESSHGAYNSLDKICPPVRGAGVCIWLHFYWIVLSDIPIRLTSSFFVLGGNSCRIPKAGREGLRGIRWEVFDRVCARKLIGVRRQVTERTS